MMIATDYDSVYGRIDRSRSKCALFDEGLEIIMKNVLQLPLDNAIPLAIYHHAGVSTWHQFMYMDESDIREATYLDENGNMKYLTRYELKLLRWLIGYVRENIDSNQFGSDLPSFYNKVGFTKYTQHRRKMNDFMASYKRTEFPLNRKVKKIPSNIVIETSHEPTNRVKASTSSTSLVKKQEQIKKEMIFAAENRSRQPAIEKSSQHRKPRSRRSKTSSRSKSKSPDKTIPNIVDIADDLKPSQHRPKSYKILREPSLSPTRPRSARSQ